MKTIKKICTLISFLWCTHLNAQNGFTCYDALSTLHQNELSFSFQGHDHIWLKHSTDTSEIEFLFLPDSVSQTTGIEKIDLYSGNDCSSLNLISTKSFSNNDSLNSDKSIVIKLPPSSTLFFLDLKKMANSNSGFRLRTFYPDVTMQCPSSCNNLIENGDFSIYSSSCILNSNSNQCPCPFNDGCICGWQSSHGTPNIFAPYSFPTIGVINSNGMFGEGIYQLLQSPVIAGRHYLLSFDYRNSGTNNIYTYNLNVQLTNANFNAGPCFDAVPSPGWDIPGTPVAQSVNWKTVVSCFTPNMNYSKLWIYPATNISQTQWIDVDNISLQLLDEPLANQEIYCGEKAILCTPCPLVNADIHYLWSTGETTQCISVSPLVTTNYNLNVSVIDNGNLLCSFDLPVTVIVHPLSQITMVSGNTNLCTANSSQSYCFNSNGASSYSYIINPPNNFIANGNCVSVNWSNIPASCASILVTAQSSACSTNAVFRICAACPGSPVNLTFCNTKASAVLNDPQYSSYISGGNLFTVPSGKWISIHGTFEIDVPFTFNNSDIRFDADAKISVDNFQVFEIVNKCHLHSCDGINMWDGIYTEDPSSLVYIHDASNLVEDAKNAIVSNNGGNYEINATTFNNNYIGILVNAYNGLHQGRVWGCQFTGTGHLLNPYANYCSLNNPAYGIMVDRVSHIQIGEPQLYGLYGRNVFQHLLCGINLNLSNADIYTSEFRDIISSSGFCLLAEGCGIHAMGQTNVACKLNIGNSSTSQLCLFDHCTSGIYERMNCNGEIISNVFTNCQIGIYNLFSSKSHNLVKGNSMDNFLRGIYFLDAINQLNYGLEIYENIFNSSMTAFNPSTYAGVAIKVVNSVSSTTNLWVTGNVINYSQIGILVKNVMEPCQIRSNTINFDILPNDAMTIGPHHGIDCENDNGLEIDANYIRWRNQPGPPSGFKNFMNGISINFSSNGNPVSGGVFENYIGPYPAVNSGSVYGMGTGINISNSCDGVSLYCNKINRCEEGITLNLARLCSQGYIDHQLQWYSNGNTFSYTPGQGGHFRIGGTVLQQVDWAYANALEDPSPFQAGTIQQHQAMNTLYHCQPPTPSPAESRDAFGSLIDSTVEPGNSDYSGYEKELKYLDEEKFYSRVKYDSAFLHAGMHDDTAYADLYSSLDQTNIAKISEVKKDIDEMNYSTALQKLSMLVDSNTIEHNKKIAMQVYLETFALGLDLDSVHAAQLEPVSMMHPVVGGEAVFWACAMLDKEVVDQLPPLRKAIPKKDTGNFNPAGVHIFPNPAKNILYVKNDLGKNLLLDITQVGGKKIFSKNLAGDRIEEEINTSSFPAGTYVIKISENDLEIFTDKLVIAR